MDYIKFDHKRELGKIISDSFLFIKQEHKALFKLILKYVVPFLFLYAYVQLKLQIKLSENVDLADPESLFQNMGPAFVKEFSLSILFSLFVQALLVTVLYTYIESYIKEGKGSMDIATVASRLFQNSGLILGVSLIWYFITLLGLFTFIVPGVYFANTLCLAIFIVVFEKKGIRNAMARSWQLVNRSWWATLLLGLTGLVIVWVLGLILSLPASLAGVDLASVSGAIKNGEYVPDATFWIVNGIISILSSILWLFPFTFLAFQYFNLSDDENAEAG